MLTTKQMMIVVLGLISLVAVGCKKKEPPTPPPPPKVTVSKPLIGEIVNYMEFTGRSESVGSVDIRARVTGFLQAAHYRDGVYVEAGDRLFSIDPDEYKAAINKQKSQWDGAVATMDERKFALAQTQVAFGKQVATALELKEKKAQYDYAVSEVGMQKALWTQANIDLGYCEMVAPISGKTSRRKVDVGNLVTSQEGTLMTTVIQQKPMYVNFSVGENLLVQIMSKNPELRKEKKGNQRESQEKMIFEVGIGEGTDYPFKAVLDYVGNKVESDTGTIPFRGVSANTDMKLIPGMFIRVRVPISKNEKAMLVPEACLGYDQAGDYVYKVNAKNVVVRQSVKVGSRRDSVVEVLSGIKPEDRVVIKGLLRCRPGRPVTPEAGTIEDKGKSAKMPTMSDAEIKKLLDSVVDSVPKEYLTKHPETLPPPPSMKQLPGTDKK